MFTEAEMRCSPACFSGRQPAAHSLRATHVAQKFCHSARRRRCTQLERTLLSGPYTDRRNTMQSVCRAERGSTASETSELPQSQPVVVERNARSQVKETANVAMVAGVAIALSAMLAVPGPADAAEAVSLDFLTKFLDQVQQLGPWGPAFFIIAVVCAEMIPLFPTQPLALSSGLLFGTTEGALCTIFSTTLAASIAFSFAQGLGRTFAQKMIDSEVGGEPGKGDNAAQKALNKVQGSVEKGSFWQQFSAVLALRMTPVLPFSATNYLMGLSSVPFKPFLAATFVAMAIWGPLYASIGAASRGVLQSRGDVGAIFSDLQARTGELSEKGAEVALVAGVVVLGLWATGVIKTDAKDDTDPGRLEQK